MILLGFWSSKGRLLQEYVDIEKGLSDEQADKLAKCLGFKDSLAKSAKDQLKRLYEMFLKVDATQVEINPFGETECNRGKEVDVLASRDGARGQELGAKTVQGAPWVT